MRCVPFRFKSPARSARQCQLGHSGVGLLRCVVQRAVAKCCDVVVERASSLAISHPQQRINSPATIRSPCSFTRRDFWPFTGILAKVIKILGPASKSWVWSFRRRQVSQTGPDWHHHAACVAKCVCPEAVTVKVTPPPPCLSRGPRR